MNNVCLVGRLTKDPELRYTTNETPMCSFTLAVDRRFKKEGQPTADFPGIVTWQKTAEFVANYFKKGMRVYVVGEIRTRNWEDDSGNKHYATQVFANHVGFADGKRDGGGGVAPTAQEEIDSSDVPF